MQLYGGIDGGQSSTEAVVADESGRILGRGTAGPADEVNQGPQSTRLRDALEGALHAALAQASLPADAEFASVFAGVSGFDGRVYGQAPVIHAKQFSIVHDAPVAHAAALGGKAGVVVIAGTGSVGFARNGSGSEAMVGGWGYVFGDEGSAFCIARRALSETFRRSDAGEPTDFAPLAMQALGVRSLRALARAFYAETIGRDAIASLAEVVLRLAQNGNQRAANLIAESATALVHLAMRAMERVGMQNPDVAFTGGLLKSATMRELIAQRMRAVLPGAHHVTPKHLPAEGALLLAYRAAGVGEPVLT